MKNNILLFLAIASTVGAVAYARTTVPANSGALSTLPPPAASDAVKALQQVCLPVLRGGDLKSSASAAGFKLRDGQWVLTINGDRRIELDPPDAANPHVCSATIYARPSNSAAIQQALNNWAGAQSPPLTSVKVDAHVSDPTQQWITSSWRAQTPTGMLGLALGQAQPTQGAPEALTESDLTVSLTPT